MFLLFFLVMLNNFCIIPVVKENTRVKLALAVPSGTPITLTKEIKDTPPLFADKTIKFLSILSKVAIYLRSFLLFAFFFLNF